MDEIQRAIAAESQSSRGSASIGNGGASVVGGAGGVCNTPSVSAFHYLMRAILSRLRETFLVMFLTKASKTAQNAKKQVMVCVVIIQLHLEE